jgi:hypothetical protein
MSILSTSPNSTRHFDMEIAAALGSFEAAVILQQLHYWTQKQGIGVIIDQAKYIYNTFEQWVKQQFTFLSVWKFRKGMDILRSHSIVKVIRYRSKEWNQTNYYNLNYDKLREWAEARNIEISELCSNTAQDEKSQTLEMRNTKVSIYESKITAKKETTEQSDRLHAKSNSIAAASLKKALEEKKRQKQSNPYSEELTSIPGQNKEQSSQIKLENQEERNIGRVDYIINKDWEKLIPELDGVGIPINKTVKSLLKLYPREKVEQAIVLLKARKRDQHIPNPSGYFVAALKQDWGARKPRCIEAVRRRPSGSKSLVESGEAEVDKAAVFRHW